MVLTKEQVQANVLSNQVIGAAIEVHRTLGPGLLESAYRNCLCRELELRGIPFAQEQALPLNYKGVKLECGYRLDILVGGLVVIELKAIDKIQPVHEAQLLTYLRLTGLWLGLLINFNTLKLVEGVKRVVN
jgi:GxxExxY protein